jgi:hypothetical protein
MKNAVQDHGTGQDENALQPAPEVALDEQIKKAQLEKLQAELRNLNSWNYELIGKVVISVLAVLLAIWSVYIGVPRAQYDALKAAQEVVSTRRDLDTLKVEAEKKSQELAERNETIETRRRQLAEANNALAQTQNALQSVKPSVSGEALTKVDAAAKPVTYVQFAGNLSRELIDAYRAALSNAGFNPPRAERINRGQQNEVRYFSSTPQEVARAATVARATKDFFDAKGCPLSPPIVARFVQLPEGKQSPLEVWLIGSCP